MQKTQRGATAPATDTPPKITSEQRYAFLKTLFYSETSCDRFDGYRHWLAFYSDVEDIDKAIDAEIAKRNARG